MSSLNNNNINNNNNNSNNNQTNNENIQTPFEMKFENFSFTTQIPVRHDDQIAPFSNEVNRALVFAPQINYRNSNGQVDSMPPSGFKSLDMMYGDQEEMSTLNSYGGAKELGLQQQSAYQYSINEKDSYMEPRPPMTKGDYLEPHYHFMSSFECKLLQSKIKSLIKTFATRRSDVASQQFLLDEWQDNESKFRFKCQACSLAGGMRTEFFIRIFTMEHSHEYAVEFQRRSGNPVLFCDVYRAFVAGLERDGAISSEVPVLKTPSLAPPPLPLTQEEESVSFVHSKETIQCLLQMLESNFVDVQCEALQALAELSFNDKLQLTMVQVGAVAAFLKATRSESVEVQRCAITCLAHLTTKNEACRCVHEDGGVDVALGLCRSNVSQVQRESARLLVNIASALGKQALVNARDHMESLITMSDPTARRLINDLRIQLN